MNDSLLIDKFLLSYEVHFSFVKYRFLILTPKKKVKKME